jgi:hypothetical protein
MPAPNVQLDDLLALAKTLRDAGYAIGTKQYIAAHELLIALAAQGQLPENPNKWQSLLGPIFCSSRLEQSEFAEHSKNWIAQRPALQKAIEATQPATVSESPLGDSVLPDRLITKLRVLQIFKRPVVWSSLTAIFTLLVMAFYLNAKTDLVLTGRVISDATKQPLVGADVTFLSKNFKTDAQGEFRFSYQIYNYERFQADKMEELTVKATDHILETQKVVVQSPTPLEIMLQKNSQPTKPTPPLLQDQKPNDRRLWLLLAWYARWLLWHLRRRRLILQKLQDTGAPPLQQLNLMGNAVRLFDTVTFRRTTVELHRHSYNESNDLDVAATVRATIRRGGFFTPSFGRRRMLPEYLLLIDRASLQDTQSCVGDDLTKHLQASDISVERFYFQSDARACRSAEPFASTVTLNELASRFPEHRLLIFGDGSGFFDPFSGKAYGWLEQFEQWTDRVVITPASPADWGYREDSLQERNFVIVPASTSGFELLTAWLNAGLITEPRRQGSRPFPEMALERPKRWLERFAPNPKVAAQLIEQLKQYLDNDGWLWLRACAVYPQITWELTLYLGTRLLGQSAKSDWAERIIPLARLPWFRYGTMPDWFRSELIAQLTAEQESKVRGVIAELLQHILTEPEVAILLEIATSPVQEHHGWQRLRSKIKQWWQRRNIYKMLQLQAEDSLLHDYVFLSFLTGKRPTRLEVQAPRWWRRVLFSDYQWVLGLRLITMVVIALSMVLSVALIINISIPEEVIGFCALLLLLSPYPLLWGVRAMMNGELLSIELPKDVPMILPTTSKTSQ